MPDNNRQNFLDFRRVIEERMTEYAREIEVLETKLEKEKCRVALEITEKPVVSPAVPQPIQHTNKFVEVLPPRPAWPAAPAPVSKVAVIKEAVSSLVKPKVPLPPVEPEEEAEEEEEAEAEEEAEEEPEAEENYEQIRVKKRTYWLETNSRKVYEITAEGDVGDLVANYVLVNGVQTLAPLSG